MMMRGRFHSYEGYPLSDVTLPIRVMARLGVKALILTNAAGAVNTGFAPGELMLIDDYINFSGQNPLRGENLEAFGPRFPDMSRAYDRELRALALDVAERENITLRQGVYAWFNGPCYETPAEIRMARVLGADAVGMSTVPETSVARHGGIKVLALSCMTNMAAGVLDQPLSHLEVLETMGRVRVPYRAFIARLIELLS